MTGHIFKGWIDHEGDTFFLEAYVEDTRPRPEGVFAAYVDVAFDLDLATVAGPLTFGHKFPNGRHGSAAVPGPEVVFSKIRVVSVSATAAVFTITWLLGRGGVKAVLVGESLMRQPDIAAATRQLLGQ